MTESHLAKSVGRLAGHCQGRIVVSRESSHHGLLAGEGWSHRTSPELGLLLLAALLAALVLTDRASLGRGERDERAAGERLGRLLT